MFVVITVKVQEIYKEINEGSRELYTFLEVTL
jgi:hypothetical protein